MPDQDPWEEAAKRFKASAPSTTGNTATAPNDDWKLWQQTSPAAQPQSKGFVGELWNEVKNGPANLLQVGNSINHAIAHPVDTFNAMGQQIEGTAKKAKEAWQGGNKVKAVREALNTGINAVAPGLGTSSSEAGEMYDRGDYAGGTGKTLGIGANVALGLKTPQIMNAAAEAPQAVRNLTRVDPRVAINRSLRPVPSDPSFPKRIPETIKAIKQANGGETPGGITNGQLDMVGATNKAIAEHQAVLDKWLARAKGVMVNGDELVDATRQSIPKMMWEQDPQGAQALIQQAQDSFGGKQYSVADFREFLRTENADLSPFYKRTPGAQADAAAAGTPPGIQQAQTQRIRDVLYKALDPEGAGAGPRTIQTKTGDLIKMRDAALRRNNAIVAEQPLTPLGKVVDPMKAAVRAVLPGKATGAGIAYAEGSEGRSLPLLKRSFKAVGDEQPNVLPEPGSPLYPTGNSSRLLTTGDQITPPPPDASYVRSAPAMYPTGPNPNRALPPGGAGPFTVGTPGMSPDQMPDLRGGRGVTVPDTSGQRVTTGPPLQAPTSRQLPQGPSVRPSSELSGQAGDITDMVPIRNPVTGKIEYVPRPGQDLPRFARGGIAGLSGPEQITVGDGGEPEAIIPLSHIRMMGPQAQRHLLHGIGSHLGIGKRKHSTLGEEIRFQEKA